MPAPLAIFATFVGFLADGWVRTARRRRRRRDWMMMMIMMMMVLTLMLTVSHPPPRSCPFPIQVGAVLMTIGMFAPAFVLTLGCHKGLEYLTTVAWLADALDGVSAGDDTRLKK
jgi:hypothetical protein